MKKLAVGIMSGTSTDGVSIAAGTFAPKIRTHAFATYAYPVKMRRRLMNAAELKTPALSMLNRELGIFFKLCLERFMKTNKLKSKHLSVIGSHGHTVCHGPDDHPAHTFQIGEASDLAQYTGVPVVCDFRARDVAAGGEGAPLIPFFDQWFFGKGPVKMLLNLGGMANLTLTGRGIETLAFDTGPGNTLIDLAVSEMTNGRESFDRDGRIAARGKIDPAAVTRMAKHPYFRRVPPKSTGREMFGGQFLSNYAPRLKGEDLVATLTWLTAYTIHRNCVRFVRRIPKEVIIGGGGVFNRTLMKHLVSLFPDSSVVSIEKHGIHPQAKEPLAFAFFAERALKGLPNHLAPVTGAKRTAVLGKILPASPRHAAR